MYDDSMGLNVREANRVEKVSELNGEIVTVVLPDLKEAEKEWHADRTICVRVELVAECRGYKAQHFRPCALGAKVAIDEQTRTVANCQRAHMFARKASFVEVADVNADAVVFEKRPTIGALQQPRVVQLLDCVDDLARQELNA